MITEAYSRDFLIIISSPPHLFIKKRFSFFTTKSNYSVSYNVNLHIMFI